MKHVGENHKKCPNFFGKELDQKAGYYKNGH
jgi:hypothetical protein